MLTQGATYRDTGWWRDHFTGLQLDLWRAVVPPAQAARDADFLQAACRLSPGDRVLDVPCGDGRVAAELAARGFDLVGVDVSPGLLGDARARPARAGRPVEWREADMRDLPWAGAFDAAYCWGDSFGYLDDAGNRAFLRAAHRALRPGGAWAMEVQMVAEVAIPRLRAEQAGAAGGIGVRVRRAYDPRAGRLAVEYALDRGGVTETRAASYRVYTCRQVCQMLERAGFAVGGLYGGAGEPFRVGSDRLRVVAAKRPDGAVGADAATAGRLSG